MVMRSGIGGTMGWDGGVQGVGRGDLKTIIWDGLG